MADEKQSTEFETAVQQVKQYVDPFNPEGLSQAELWGKLGDKFQGIFPGEE